MADVRAGIYKVVTKCRADDQIGVNVHYALSNAAVAGYPEQTLCNDLMAYLATGLRPLLAQTAFFESVYLQHMFDAPVSAGVNSAGVALAGTDANDMLPRQSSGIITWYTAVGGRKGRGRTYVPFPSELSNDANGIPTDNYVTRLTTYALQFLTWVVPKTGGGNITLQKVIGPKNAATYIVVALAQPRKKWATQRRRGSYGKQNP